MSLVKFLASTTGRIVRAVAGIALIVIGLAAQTTAGYIVAGIGVIPLLAGLLDVCLFAPLFGAPFSGKKIRSQ